jgi:hypothetical protein
VFGVGFPLKRAVALLACCRCLRPSKLHLLQAVTVTQVSLSLYDLYVAVLLLTSCDSRAAERATPRAGAEAYESPAFCCQATTTATDQQQQQAKYNEGTPSTNGHVSPERHIEIEDLDANLHHAHE